MTSTYFSGKLTPSPSAKDCRERLGNLSYQNEKRKGKMRYALLYFGLTITFIFGFIFVAATYFDIPKPFDFVFTSVVSLLGIYVGFVLISHEQKLTNRNEVGIVKEKLSGYFADGEKLLCLFVGRVNQFPTPGWLGAISPYSYFVITSDRLLLITFKESFIGTNQINNALRQGYFESIITNIFTCSLGDQGSVRFGGFITHPALLNLTHTKAITRPIGQTEPYRWVIDDKMTQNGIVLRYVLSALDK